MSAFEDCRTGVAELDAHRFDVVNWVETAHVQALVNEADLQSTRRRRLALQREAHDDRAVGVEYVVRDDPINLERALVLREFFYCGLVCRL